MDKEQSQLRSSNIMEALGRIHADIATLSNDVDWIKKSLEETKTKLSMKDKDDGEKYASKYVEKMVWVLMAGTACWALTQLLNLIPTAYALTINYL